MRAAAVTVEPGGKGFNLALGVHRLGCSVDGILAIGDDLLASFAEPALQAAGLPASMLRRFPGPTGSGIGFTDISGENCLAVAPGANLRMSAGDIRGMAERICDACLVMAQFEIEDAPVLEAFALAREAGVTTLLKPSPFRRLSPELLAQTSILIVNETEAAALSAELLPNLAESPGSAEGPPFSSLADAVIARGVNTLIVTLGAAGAWAFRGGAAPLFQPSFAIEPVDTLGAGDAFAAGLGAALAQGASFEDALRRAAGCGAMATLGLGVVSMLPTSGELDAFLKVTPYRLELFGSVLDFPKGDS